MILSLLLLIELIIFIMIHFNNYIRVLSEISILIVIVRKKKDGNFVKNLVKNYTFSCLCPDLKVSRFREWSLF